MVNMTARGVAAPKLDVPNAPQSGGLQMPTNQGGIGTIAAGLGELNATLTDLSNRANVAAGKEEGAVAGLTAAQAGQSPAFKRDGSLRGDAYDQAAMESGLAVLETKLRTDLSDLANNTLDDPASWQAGADKIVGDTVTALQNRDPQMATQMALIAAQARASGDVNARKRMVELGVSARKSAIDGLIETRGNAVINLARQDTSTPQAQAALTAETEGLIQALVKLGPRGAFEAGGRQFGADDTRAGSLMPEQIGQTLRDLSKKVAIETSLGAFDRAPTVKAKREMLAALDSDITKGTGLAATLGVDTARAAHDAMQGRLAAAVGAEAVVKNELIGDLNDLNDVARSGFAPPAAQITDVLARANSMGDTDLIAKATELQAVAALSPQLNGMSVPALGRWIANKQNQMASSATPQNLAELSLANDIYGRKMAAEAASSMGGGGASLPQWYRSSRGGGGSPGGGSRGGGGGGAAKVSASAEIDLERLTAESAGGIGQANLTPMIKDGQTTARLVSNRVVQVETYARLNGTFVNANAITLSSERTSFAMALNEGGINALRTASALAQGGGAYGAGILADISPNGLGLLLASELHRRGGRAGELAAQGQLLHNRGVRMPSGGVIAGRIMNEEFGDAYRGNLQERNAAVWVATRAYIAMQNGKPEAANEFDAGLWRDAVRASMGVQRVRGEDFGGPASYRRQRVEAPTWMVARRFEEVWSELTVEDWRAMHMPVVANPGFGKSTPATQFNLRQARELRPVSRGDGEGKYRLIRPDGTFVTANNRPVVINMRNIAPRIHQRYRGEFTR